MAEENKPEVDEFGDTRGVDPVSGNPIPIGSTAENVRDDIPAQLSEGEYVVPADVVNYWGIKLFEDLRAAAKMGWLRMEATGRIGGDDIDPEPQPDTTGLGLTLDDLEIMDDGQDEAPEGMNKGGMVEVPPEGAFLGKLFSRIIRGDVESDDAKPRDRSFKAIKERARKQKDTRNRAEELLKRFREKRDEAARDKTGKPKIDFGFRGNPMERASRKYGTESEPTQNKPLRSNKSPGSVRQAYRGMPEKQEETFAKRLNFPGFAEGGAVEDFPIVTPPSDIFQEGNPGGFGSGYANDFIQNQQGVMEAREYQNEAGHKIIIMFLDGEPITPIPEGYYPVADGAVIPVDQDVGEVIANVGKSRSNDDDDDGPTVIPTPIDYKALSVDELGKMVKDQTSLKGDLISAGMGMINPILGLVTKFAMYDQAKKTEAELIRRLEEGGDDMPVYEKEYLEGLLETAQADKPGLIQRLFGDDEEAKKKAGITPEEELGAGERPEIEVTELEPIQGYTPELVDNSSPHTAEPYIPSSYGPEIMAEVEKASKEAALKAFKSYAPVTSSSDDKPNVTYRPDDNDDFIQKVLDNPTSFLPPTPSDDDDDDDGPPAPSYTAPGGLYSEPGRPTGGNRSGFGGGGRNKGGIVEKQMKDILKK
jgi:hypothetical protein